MWGVIMCLKKAYPFYLSLLFLCVLSIQAKDTLITLQNDLNDYSGCVDATIYDGYYDNSKDSINFGDDSSLTVLKYNFGEGSR